MKTILLQLSILLLSFGKMSAQNWLPVGTEWHYITNTFAGVPIEDNIFAITGDTIIMGKQCAVLSKSNVSCDYRPLTDFLYKENDKLYYLDEDAMEFNLYFDYSKQKGDILALPSYSEMRLVEDIDSVYIRIDSVYEIDILGTNLKVFEISDGLKDAEGEIEFMKPRIDRNNLMIEDYGRAGSFYNFIDWGLCDGPYSFPLRQIVIPNLGTYNALLITDIKIENIDSDIIAYPMPFNDVIKIKNLDDEVASILIFDSNSQLIGKINKVQFDNDNHSLNTAMLSQGSYFIVIKNLNNQIIRSMKIMKL